MKKARTPIDLNEINIFHRVLLTGSFTAAAKTLGLPKSTVSERVARLEERLGVRLIERTTRKLRPTDAGLAYFERAARIVGEAEEADAAVTDLAASPHGLIRVFSPLVVARAFLNDVATEFLLAHPRVELELVAADRRVDLLEESFDLGIHVIGPIDPTYIARRLGASDRFFVASPGYVAARGGPSHPDELARHDLIAVGAERRSRWLIERDGRGEEREIHARYAVTSLELALAAAERGLGITIAPAILAAEAIREGRLVRVMPRYSGGAGTITLIYPSSRNLSNRVRLLVELVLRRWAEVPLEVLRGEPSPKR